MKQSLPHALLALWVLGFLYPTLMAQPGSGVRLGQQTLLVPSVSVYYTYDDNVNIRRRALSVGGDELEQNDSDSYLNARTKLDMTHWNSSARFSGVAWLSRQEYRERTELNEDTYGVEGSVSWTRPNGDTTFKVMGSYQRAVERSERSDDFTADLEQSRELENIGERVKRDEARAHMELNRRLITDVRGVFSYAYADYDYHLDQFNDSQSHTPVAELTYQLSPKTQPYVKAGVTFTEDEGFESTAQNVTYLLGTRYSPTPKLDLDLAGGYEYYERTPNEGVHAGEKLDDSTLKWTARINYALSRKTRATLSGRTGFGSVASPGSSSREVTSVSFALNHHITHQLSHRASIAWRHDDYISPFPARGTTYDETKETFYYQYRIDYQTVQPWLSLFAQAGLEDGSSKVPGDSYTQTELRFGATARY